MSSRLNARFEADHRIGRRRRHTQRCCAEQKFTAGQLAVDAFLGVYLICPMDRFSVNVLDFIPVSL